jgi:hypothetical protein
MPRSSAITRVPSRPAGPPPEPAAPRQAPRLPWPLPALLAWSAAWALTVGGPQLGLDAATALLASLFLSSLAGLVTVLVGGSRWRGWIVAAGFPVSFSLQRLMHGLSGPEFDLVAPGGPALPFDRFPAWAWLVPLALLLMAYPLRAWRDAPFFPTEIDALEGLAEVAPLAAQAQLLDAGCGLGHGLQALRRVYPQARLNGVEWSWPLRALAALRCPWARVRRGDMWDGSWAEQDLVYLFQRPESMARAGEKARAEMRPGSWLVSLEFKVPGLRLHALLQREGHRPVWVYAPAGPRRDH